MQCSTGGCLEDALGSRWGIQVGDGRGAAALTAAYAEARRIAWVVLTVYAICVPCFYAVLLRLARRAIVAKRRTPLSDALSFLHEGYAPLFYWWELTNVVRKLAVVGSTLVMPGTIMQVVAALMIVVVFQLLLVLVQPYGTREAALIAEVEQMALLLFILLCLIVRSEQLAKQAGEFLTPGIYRRYFWDIEAMADVMVLSLVGCVGFATFFSVRQVLANNLEQYWKVLRQYWHKLLHCWQDSTTHSSDRVQPFVEESNQRARLAARTAAGARLRAALDHQASMLAVSVFVHAADAEPNPVLVKNIFKARAVARTTKLQATRGTAPGRHDGAVRVLKLNIKSKPRTVDTKELHDYLTRIEHVRALVPEALAPKASASLRRRAIEIAKHQAPMTESNFEQEMATARSNLTNVGFKGPEPVSARTHWQLTLHRARHHPTGLDALQCPNEIRASQPGEQCQSDHPEQRQSNHCSRESKLRLDLSRPHQARITSRRPESLDEATLRTRRERRASIAEAEKALAAHEEGHRQQGTKEGPGRKTYRRRCTEASQPDKRFSRPDPRCHVQRESAAAHGAHIDEADAWPDLLLDGGQSDDPFKAVAPHALPRPRAWRATGLLMAHATGTLARRADVQADAATKTADGTDDGSNGEEMGSESHQHHLGLCGV